MVQRLNSEGKDIEFNFPELGVDKLPSYIKVNGVVYEKLECMASESVEIEIPLTEDFNAILDKALVSGGFVNRQELVRAVMRRQIEKQKRDCLNGFEK